MGRPSELFKRWIENVPNSRVETCFYIGAANIRPSLGGPTDLSEPIGPVQVEWAGSDVWVDKVIFLAEWICALWDLAQPIFPIK